MSRPDPRSVPADQPLRGSGRAEAEAAEGDLDLLTLYEGHRERILRYCLALLKNPEDAEDAAQETFARAASQVSRLEGDPTAYLTTIARNVCYDVVRHRSRKGTRDLDSVVVIDDRVGPEHRAVASELAKQLWGNLSADERVFLAHSFAGFRYEEIAERTGRSVPAISVSICRARQRLRRLSGALGAAVAVALLAPRSLNRLWRRSTGAAGNAASAMASLDPAMISAVLLGAAGTLGNLIGGVSPSASASAVRAPAAMARLTAPDRVPSTPAPTPLAVAAQDPARSHSVPPTDDALLTPLAPSLPGSAASPQDVQFTAISPSPNYPQDRTAYASGSDVRTCPTGQVCPVLFVTHDGGASWTQRQAAGFPGGAVMVPAGYPADPTVFVAGPQGLLLSPDGGNHFSTAVQVAGPSAIAPDSTPGAARIAIVQGAVWVYQQATGTLVAGPTLPAGIVPESAVYASPSVLLVVGQQYDVLPAPHRSPVVVRCAATSCATAAAFPEDADVRLAALSDAQVLAYSTSRIYRSTDLGASFATVFDAGADRITAVGATMVPAGERQLSVVAELTPAGTPKLLLGDVATGGWSRLPTTSLGLGVAAVVPLEDGSIVSAVTLGGDGGYGLRCLSAAAADWRPSC